MPRQLQPFYRMSPKTTYDRESSQVRVLQTCSFETLALFCICHFNINWFIEGSIHDGRDPK